MNGYMFAGDTFDLTDELRNDDEAVAMAKRYAESTGERINLYRFFTTIEPNPTDEDRKTE